MSPAQTETQIATQAKTDQPGKSLSRPFIPAPSSLDFICFLPGLLPVITMVMYSGEKHRTKTVY